MTTPSERQAKHFVEYTFTHALLGEVEVDLQYEVDDPNGEPFIRILGVREGRRWLSMPMSPNGRDHHFVGEAGRVLEQAIVALIMDEAYANPDWTASLLQNHGYEYRGEGGNDPDGRWVRLRERAEA